MHADTLTRRFEACRSEDQATPMWGLARSRCAAGASAKLAATRSFATKPKAGTTAPLRPGQDKTGAARKHRDGSKSHSREHEQSANEMAAPFYKGITLAMVAAAGYFVLPSALTSSVPQAGKLCASKDVFMQRSGVSRMVMIAANKSMHKQILLDAIDPLVKVLRESEEEDILDQVLDVILTVATQGADDDRELMCLDGALEAAQQLTAKENCSATIRAKAAEASTALELRDGTVSQIPMV